MRIIKLSKTRVTQEHAGSSLIIPVKVDWPEFQLTEAQMAANAWALGLDRAAPYEDESIIVIEITDD